MTLANTLTSVGLTARESELYLASLKLGPSSILTLSSATKIHRPQLYKLLEELIEKGIFRTTLSGKRKLYVATPPKQLLQYLKLRENLLLQIMPELEAITTSSSSKARILYFEGREQVKELLKTQHQCQSGQIYSFFPSKYMAELFGKREMEQVIHERIKLQIHARILRAAPAEEEFEGSELRTKALREVRYIPHDKVFKMGIVIFDDKVNLFSPIEENFGIQIQSTAYSVLMKYFFECLWSISTPEPR